MSGTIQEEMEQENPIGPFLHLFGWLQEHENKSNNQKVTHMLILRETSFMAGILEKRLSFLGTSMTSF